MGPVSGRRMGVRFEETEGWLTFGRGDRSHALTKIIFRGPVVRDLNGSLDLANFQWAGRGDRGGSSGKGRNGGGGKSNTGSRS